MSNVYAVELTDAISQTLLEGLDLLESNLPYEDQLSEEQVEQQAEAIKEARRHLQ